ncbi:MAG: shikimate kinase [Actinomycetes bacterium]
MSGSERSVEAPPDTRVLLVGMMGAGKSTVGRALSAATAWPYVDNDECVVAATGREAPDILDADGEPALRRAESAALMHALGIPPPVVAGVAGGVVLDAGDRARLAAGGFVVWLRARVETLVRRVGSGSGRAWLRPDPEAALRRFSEARASLYAEAATLVVDVDDASPEDIAAQIVDALSR